MKTHPSPSIFIAIAFLITINVSEIEAQKYPRGPLWTEAKVITPCPSISCGDAYSISDIRCVMEVAQLQDVTVDDAKCIAAGLGRRDLMRKQICPVHPSCQTCKDYKTSQSGLCIDQTFCKATKRKVIPGLCGAGGRVCCVGEGKTPEEQIKTPIPCKNPAGAAGTCMKMQSCTKAKGSSFPGCQGLSVCCVSRTSEMKQGISNTLTKIKDKVTGFFSKPTPPTTNSGIIISDTSKSAAGRVAGTNLLQQQEQEQAQLRHN